MGYTGVNEILKPSLSFNKKCNCSPIPITYRKLGQELEGISGTKNLVDGNKMSRSFLMVEVRDKDA